MSIKTADVDIPMGGGKGGITVNPRALSHAELERLTRAYTERIFRDIGPRVDVPAPDVNTTSEMMDWIADEYGRLTGAAATAMGGFFVLLAAMHDAGEQIAGKRVAIQGFGNAGANAALLLDEAGAIVVAVSDSTAAVVSDLGLPVNELVHFKAGGGRFADLDSSFQQLDPEEILTYNVDILVPAALEGQITEENAHDVRARYIVELANGPTTPEADAILEASNVLVLPDILANAGGVVVSYFEWVQDLNRDHWSEKVVNEKLREIMVRSFQETLTIARRESCYMRTAAYLLAVQRVADATQLRGLYP